VGGPVAAAAVSRRAVSSSLSSCIDKCFRCVSCVCERIHSVWRAILCKRTWREAFPTPRCRDLNEFLFLVLWQAMLYVMAAVLFIELGTSPQVWCLIILSYGYSVIWL